MPPESSHAAPVSRSLNRVAKGDLCAGCGACAALAPGKVVMADTAPGYLRPVVRAALTAAEEAAIARTCPGLGQRVDAAGRTDDALWGPYLDMKTGHATDAGVRFAGSSGGALSMLLLHLLDSGAVDAVLQTGADPDFPIGNATVISTGRDGVLAAAGSRYAPSAPLADLPARIASGQRHAFVGKPCDAVALRAMAAQDPAVAAAFPVILSFFCAGVPSHSGGRAVLAALGTTPDNTRSFRYRGNGWPGRATAVLADGSERAMSYFESWGKILSRHVQTRCKICADGTGVAADLVCADAWEADAEGYPVFAEADGISLIVARTALGARILAEAEAAGRLETTAFDVAGLAAIQPGQRDRRRGLLARLLVLRLLGRPVPQYHGLRLFAAARQSSLRANLQNALGMFRRGRKIRR
jgi:coenzyme F420 hydrogenase subunit beta